MNDLYIDYAMLQRVRENLKRIEELLEKPAQQMKEIDTKALGASQLEERMDSFGEEEVLLDHGELTRSGVSDQAEDLAPEAVWWLQG